MPYNYSMQTQIDLMTTASKIAEAMNPGGLAVFNAGCYQGTNLRIRQLTGNEPVRVIGSNTGARIEAESWVVDRFGGLGARQIKVLKSIL